MHHCVASYATSCASGRCAIFSLKLEDGGGAIRRVTIGVETKSRKIVQVRGRYNRMPEPMDERFIRNWATVANLSIRCF